MHTARLTLHPDAIRVTPLRAFHIERGEGNAVAMLFRVAVAHAHEPRAQRHQNGGDQQAQDAVGAKE
jgi:hypothetical protein